MEAVDTLQKYGSSYQSKVVAAFLTDSKFLEQVYDITNKDFFESEANRWVVNEIVKYYPLYRTAPSIDVFKIKVKEIENEAVQKIIVEQLKHIYTLFGSTDLPYVKQEYLKFSKHQKLKEAIFKSVDLIKAERLDEVGSIINDALKAGLESNFGLDYLEDIDLIMEETKRNSVPTGWKVVNDLMDGGLGPGELGVVLAPSGIGKTWFLSKLACDALKAGKNVLHYTLELSETYVGHRYSTILTGIPSDKLKERKDEIKQKVSHISGKVIIKYYPPQAASTKTLHAHIDKLAGIGFKPDIIIIDYADLLKSANKGRDNLYAELGGIYEELRGLGGELGIPIWTASQTNRAAIEHEVIQADSVGDSYKKVQTADFIMSVSRKTKDKLANTARIHIVKNRFGPDGLTFPAKLDTQVGQIDIFDQASTEGMSATKESNNGQLLERKLLHKKYVENMG